MLICRKVEEHYNFCAASTTSSSQEKIQDQRFRKKTRKNIIMNIQNKVDLNYLVNEYTHNTLLHANMWYKDNIYQFGSFCVYRKSIVLC